MITIEMIGVAQQQKRANLNEWIASLTGRPEARVRLFGVDACRVVRRLRSPRYLRVSQITTGWTLAPALFRLPLLLIAIAYLSASWLTASAAAQVAVRGQGFLPFREEPINYGSAPAHDPVAELQKQLDRREASLQHANPSGYLTSVLSALKIPVSSQTLVFSKTSFQFRNISPQTPRALYFNDDV